ncbi:sporulation sensor histidine kinase E [Fictibacillus macauensis ZFHKF-1]|uniref:histidine kinase n=1 Tax=Fictibacillus macauensis ZFHKF-1 TaxID=1196324 RepID=I8UG35_9BACL|nr:PAS domain-containing sensor histidine kinase [Fictibacillus macauensis]EIT85793.1 sporulation sensor histidine kinase E [Fictibacillus macauensis ZFHKF-1]
MVENSLAKMSMTVRSLDFFFNQAFSVKDSGREFVHSFALKKTSVGNYAVSVAEEAVTGFGFQEEWIDYILPKNEVKAWEVFFEKAFQGELCFYETEVDDRLFTTILTPIYRDGIVSEVIGRTIDRTPSSLPMEREGIIRKYKEIFKHTLHPTLLVDDHMVVSEANPAACQLLQLYPFPSGQCRLHELLQPHNANEFFWNWDVFRIDRHHTWEYKTGDITEGRTIEVRGKHDILNGMHLMILQDVTEQRQTEERLRKAETLNVVGEMAAGIAHEIRNPLTSLKGFIQLIKNESSTNGPYYSIILNEVDRIEHILSEFLQLAKTDHQQVENSNLIPVLIETVTLLQTQAILKNIVLQLEIGEQIPPIECDPFQIKQVFINLIKNGIEATQISGKIKVSAHFLPKEKMVAFRFADNGTGMPHHVLNRIGKPFYTTKEEGTGLGLMVSYKIIEKHKGSIQVSSEVGKGTTFEVRLPVLQNT